MKERSHGECIQGIRSGTGRPAGDDVMTPEEEKTSLYLPISQVESCASQPRSNLTRTLWPIWRTPSGAWHHSALTVRKLQSGYYQIIAGERRLRASPDGGSVGGAAIVIEADDRKAMELAMIENLQREDLNPLRRLRATSR